MQSISFISSSKSLPPQLDGTGISIPVKITHGGKKYHAVYNYETKEWNLIGTGISDSGMLVQISRNDMRAIENELKKTNVYWRELGVN